MNPLGKALIILADCFEHVKENEMMFCESTAWNAKEILRHAMIHLADPMWERRWPSAVKEN
jgi:hypothetical protein